MGNKQHGLRGSTGGIECCHRTYLKSWRGKALFRRLLYLLSHRTNKRIAFFDMPMGTCCHYLTFRGKLVKIKLYDKHETSHECQEQCYEEFLLTKILDPPSVPEISSNL